MDLVIQRYCMFECLPESIWQIDSTKIYSKSEDTVSIWSWGRTGCLFWGQNLTKYKKFCGSSRIILIVWGCWNDTKTLWMAYFCLIIDIIFLHNFCYSFYLSKNHYNQHGESNGIRNTIFLFPATKSRYVKGACHTVMIMGVSSVCPCW